MDLGLGFDQAAIGMALVGLDGRFLRVNRALCELLGRSEAELLDSTPSATWPSPGTTRSWPTWAGPRPPRAPSRPSRSSGAAGGPTGLASTCSSAPPCCTTP